jgi:predicted nucleic acid-binding protein
VHIVVDTSAVVAVVLDEPEKPQLEKHTADASLLAPASLPWEFGNARSLMFKKGRISVKEAGAAIEVLREIPIELVDVDLRAAVELSHTHRIYAYDAYMLVCAQERRSPLLTLDLPLRALAGRLGIRVLEV